VCARWSATPSWWPKPDTELPPLTDVEVWREPQASFHPVHGILHALSRAGDRTIVVVPGRHAARARGAARPPRRRGRRRLPGGHRPRRRTPAAACAEAFTPEAFAPLAAAADDAPLTRTLEALGAVVVGRGEGEDALLVNVNTPADLARAETLLSAGGGG
jgi:molybdopterin-guanine dinucleotide biosynthesis protein A